jgi:CheY-like chemotaxis protein
MGSRLQLASPERLLDHIRSAGVPRVLVLLDHSLGHARVARLAAAARAAARPATRIEVVVLVPPGSDAWVDAAERPLPYLLKPVVRRRLAGFMSTDPALAAVSVEEGPKRILVVEDDYGIRVFYKRFLPRILEAEVVEAATVKEALAALAPPPRLAIVDLSLPDGEGTEVARVIRERWGRDVLVVATSGYDESRIEPLLRDGTFDAFLPKPSPLDQIETLLGDLLSRSPTRTSALALSGS